jgi:integrase
MSDTNKGVTVQRGSVVVRIYKRQKAGCEYYQVADYSSGRRKFKSFTELKVAKKTALSIADKMSKGDAAALTLTNQDRSSYVRSVANLKPTKVPLETATARYAEAFKILGGDFLIEAARYFAKKHPSKYPQKTVKVVVAEFIESKSSRVREEDDGKGLSDRYIQDLKYRCNKFAKAFNCKMGSNTTKEIEEFLTGLGLSTRSYINFRRVLGTLFEFAKRRGYLPRDHDEMALVEQVEDEDGPIEIYTPDEITRLLKAASSDFRPCLAIGAFAGLRSSEIERLDWSDVRLVDRFIEVRARKGKKRSASRRIVPILDNLAKWLADYSSKKGLVWTGDHDSFYEVQQETAAATVTPELEAMKWKANALRHSFISYRLAKVQSAAQVALEAGNSPKMIFQHYRELVRPAEAETWFGVVPKPS